MRSLRMFAALVLFGCAPSVPADTKAPHDVGTPAGGPLVSPTTASAASAAAPPNAAATPRTPGSSAAGPSAAGPSAAGPSAAASPSGPSTSAPATPKAPALERLTYHALPQTHLGFYGVLTPPGYDAPENAGRRYPVVVILHGSGSNEVVHGSLADDIGRDEVIYVLPRAPHPSPEQFAAGKEGYTAWPSYPAQWGEYGSPDFPQAEVDKLQVHKYYTRWIAESLLDARERYRVSPNRAVVVGHSQGATFAHLFAADYPALVKAYVAYAGPSRLTVKSADGKRQLASLRNAAVVPMLIHHEADTVVDVQNTKALDAMMTEQGVKHTTHILPGGSHATDPEVRHLLRSFAREQCCGKERTTADIPVSPAGTLSVPPMKDIMTFGPDRCDERVSALTQCANASESIPARCELYEAEPCGSRSFGYRATSFECVNSVWTRVSKSPAECGVERRDPVVAGCNLQLFRTRPSAQSKTDACDLVMRCGRVQTVVTCDGENDGTGSSLCECTRNGVAVQLPQSVYAGEAPQSCVAAAQQCVTVQ
jgi:predicted esterase